MTKKEINKKIENGRCVRVQFEDIGQCDGVVIDVDKDDSSARVMFFSGFGNQRVEYSQIVAIGKHITPVF